MPLRDQVGCWTLLTIALPEGSAKNTLSTGLNVSADQRETPGPLPILSEA
jgi:hypothetical protein